MSSIRKLKNGRVQVSYENKFRGVARTKRTFDTRKEAQEWVAAVHGDATARLLGHQRRHLFGEALARYLREESPKKKTHDEDLERARLLRWPIWDPDTRRWLRLEETPIEETPGVLARWIADLKPVARRSYLTKRQFHKRPGSGGALVWFEQPAPTADARPEPRREVTDSTLIEALDRAPGRGPFDSGTLRKRQQLVSRILRIAWKHWSGPGDVWLAQDIAGKINLEAKSASCTRFLTYDQLLALLIAAPVHFDDAILAAAWIGWRRANVVGRAARGKKGTVGYRPALPGLEWSNVVFPVHDEHGRLVQAGYVWKDKDETKSEKPLAQPLSDRVEQLLRLRWDLRDGHGVFHRGDGRPFLEFRRMWMTAKRRAGIDPAFRWHDLRHTFGSEMVRANVPARQLQELMGHASITTTQIYTHLHLDHLRDAVNAPGNKRMN